MSKEAIARDIEQQLIRELQELLNRRMSVASKVLDTFDLVVMICNVAASVVLGAQVVVASQCSPGDEAALLDAHEKELVSRIGHNRDKVMRTAAALRRGERPEQAL